MLDVFPFDVLLLFLEAVAPFVLSAVLLFFDLAVFDFLSVFESAFVAVLVSFFESVFESSFADSSFFSVTVTVTSESEATPFVPTAWNLTL